MSEVTAMSATELARFYDRLEIAQVRGQWQSEGIRKSGAGGVTYREDGSFVPQVGGAPKLWPWAAMRELLEQSCLAVPESLTARRSLGLNNPALPRGTTHTMVMALQMIRPGELAWAHRHSMAALRFAIEGSSALRTVVNGEICPMEPYDLVLTPAWHWHDHRNAGRTPAVWLDVLDAPLATSLNHLFYEPFGEEQQPVSNHAASSTPQMAPPAQVLAAAPLQRLRFPWSEVEPLLLAADPHRGSPYDGTLLDYVQPDGGPTMPTLGCSIQRLRPGEETRSHRHSSSAVYFVVRGAGESIIGEQRLEWGRHDCFVLPSWTPHAHRNHSAAGDAVLFSVTDIPLLRYLGLYREEPEISVSRTFPAVAQLVEPGFRYDPRSE